MSTFSIDLPEPVLLRARAQGAEGEAWIAVLPELVGELAADWGLTVGRTLSGGTEAYAAEVAMADGRAAVLKVQPPGRDPDSRQLAVLLLAQGQGYAEVYAHDDGRRAVLLEKLGRQLVATGWSVEAQIEALCATLKSAWQPLSSAGDFQTGAEKAAVLVAFIADLWEELDRPCPEATIEAALACARAREAAFDPARAVLGHGDAHAWNALEAPGGGFKFVDPDGLYIEPEYDLGVAMREWTEDLLAGDPLERGRARCLRLAELTGGDPTAIWQWGLTERTSTALLALKLGLEGGAEMLAVSNAWAADRLGNFG